MLLKSSKAADKVCVFDVQSRSCRLAAEGWVEIVPDPKNRSYYMKAKV